MEKKKPIDSLPRRRDLLFASAAFLPMKKLKPPVAKRIPKRIAMHGETRVDDYFWLRGKENPEVIAYLEAENGYTSQIMAPTEALQKKLYDEILGRIQQTDLSVPARIGDFFYYTRTEEGRPYSIYCRKPGSLDGAEQVLLDLNDLAKDEKYLRLGNFSISPDHRMVAYALDTSGDEVYTVFVKEIASGRVLPDRIPNTYYGLEWTNDNQSLVYVTLDEAKRPYRAWRHVLGATSGSLLYEEKDERFHLTLGKARSRRFLYIRLNSAITSEIHYAEAATASEPLKRFAARAENVMYDVEHHGDRFYIRTQDGGRNYRLLRTPVSDISRARWEEVLPHRTAVTIEDVTAFENHLVLIERDNGQLKFRVRELPSGAEHWVEMPEAVYRIGFDHNPEFRTSTLRLQYTSLITPLSVYDYDMAARTRDLKKRQKVLGGYDPANYETHRLQATAPDGVKVPISLVYRKGLKRDGRNPALLYGYGSYGISVDPSFASDRLSLIDRGFVYAIAHIRGGADMGELWHDDGKLKRKKNTFTDFIACAEHLIQEKFTNPKRLAISGRSAGGLLMGAVVNLRPDLFQTVIAGVPFVDVLNTATDPTLPLTVIEYDEWGNSNFKEFFDYIQSYSPYDNVKPASYPNILATAGLNDPRVSYWEPAKWVAKLRTVKKDRNLLLLKTNMAAGHGGSSSRYEKIRETAFEYAFLLHTMGFKG